MIYWSVDTLDWKNRNVNYVYKEIIKSADKGEIILLHDSHPTSVDGFIKALPELNKKGYELVTVSELFKLNKKNLNCIIYLVIFSKLNKYPLEIVSYYTV